LLSGLIFIGGEMSVFDAQIAIAKLLTLSNRKLVIDLSALFEFSRNHCVAICSFLVPAILLTTLQTCLFRWMKRPQLQVVCAGFLASTLAGAIVLHVLTWVAIGVLTPVSFVLLGLGSVCLVLNAGAIAYPQISSRLRFPIQDRYKFN